MYESAQEFKSLKIYEPLCQLNSKNHCVLRVVGKIEFSLKIWKYVQATRRIKHIILLRVVINI